MKYIKLFEGFKESEFIRTETYKNYVINKFQPGDIDDLEIKNYNKEINAIDYIISKHF